MTNPFQFEEGNYKPGFTKPIMLLEKRIVGIPYHDIVEEQVTEEVWPPDVRNVEDFR